MTCGAKKLVASPLNSPCQSAGENVVLIFSGFTGCGDDADVADAAESVGSEKLLWL